MEETTLPILGKTLEEKYFCILSGKPCLEDTIASVLGDGMAGRIRKYLREHGVLQRLTAKEEEPLVPPTALLPKRLYFSHESIGLWRTC